MRKRLLPAILVAAALALGACTGGDDTPDKVAGGAHTLPGPAPAGLALKPPATEAPTAPRFSATLTDGTDIDVSTLWADRPVVLTFFSSWCTICADRQDAMSELARTYQDRVVFLGVAGEDEADPLDEYLRTHKVEYPVVLDDSMNVWRAYAVREPPAVIILSKDGRLLRGWPGGIDAAALDTQLKEHVLG
ncbi:MULTISPECIES: TlpA disulfide reductase family protein [Polymorphospora]|uniref:TlpA disulfide reductase family protein n=1 Tax=Polymorphospora lycopeni TaxID=3140240 RepID=A0ABV5CLS5_9ACTN